MKKLFLALLAISLLTNCNSPQTKPVDKNDAPELTPGQDTALQEGNEKQQNTNSTTCVFANPDTSVVGIILRNAESTAKILGKQSKLKGDSPNVFYSNDKKQTLRLTVHPGDNYNQVSIFKISYADSEKQNFRKINATKFETEKGIRLGISKKEIIEKLGMCYVSKDSTTNNIELDYRLELPNDSKTKLLKSSNMPIYYASYKLSNDKLENIEFGFEYP